MRVKKHIRKTKNKATVVKPHSRSSKIKRRLGIASSIHAQQSFENSLAALHKNVTKANNP